MDDKSLDKLNKRKGKDWITVLLTVGFAAVLCVGIPVIVVQMSDSASNVQQATDHQWTEAATPNVKSGRVELYTDPLTSCQYLVAGGNAITPRMKVDGTQVCLNPPSAGHKRPTGQNVNLTF